jgi:hypothetical protein
MNTLEASQELLNWFIKNDSFSIKTNFSVINKKSELSLADEGAITLALNGLEKMEIARPFSSGAEKIWILQKPLFLFGQTVDISGPSAIHISNIINNFFSLSDDKENMSDSSNITEEDIMKLVEICSFLADNLSKQNEPSKEKSKSK